MDKAYRAFGQIGDTLSKPSKAQLKNGTVKIPPTPNKPAQIPANAPAITNPTYNISEIVFAYFFDTWLLGWPAFSVLSFY